MKCGVFSTVFAFAVLAAAAIVTAVKPPTFETSLEALAGEKSVSLPEPVRRSVSSRVQVVASSEDFDAAVSLAEEFVGSLGGRYADNVRFRVDGAGLSETLSFYREHGGGFLSARDRRAMDTGNLLEEVFERVASPVPSLFPFKDDPCRFTDDFVKAVPQGFGKWRMRDGVLAADKDGVSHVLVSLALPGDAAFDIGELPEILNPAVETCRKLNSRKGPARLSIGGVPVHTLESSQRCERQIGFLSFFSLAFILALSFFALRSVEDIRSVAVGLAVSAAAGFAAVDLLFDRIYLVSLVFGTVLIGLAADYSFHRLLTSGRAGFREVRMNLVKSFLTTVVSFMPLAFSGIGALIQSAVFLVGGLTAGLLFNLSGRHSVGERGDAGSGPEKTDERFLRPWPGARAVPWFLASVSVVALFFADFRTDVHDLYTPSAELARSERLMAELSGLASGSAMAVLKGRSLEDVLAAEERLLPESSGISRFVPSFAKRTENHALIKRFLDKEGGKLAGLLGFSGKLPEPEPPREISVEDIPEAIAGQFVFKGAGGKVMTIVPGVMKDRAGTVRDENGTEIEFYSPSTAIAAMLDGYGEKVLRLLFVSFALLLSLLWVFFRSRAVLVVLPSALAVAASFAFIVFTGRNVNLFHLLGSFMTVGITLDYSIFLASDFRRGLKAVLCSFLTSLAGFGALAFVSFPVVGSFGTVLAVGLPVAFAVSCIIFRPRPDSGEVAASGAGMEMLWMVYRVFGKRVLDFTTGLVAGTVWLFSAKARRAAGSRRRLMEFARSLADKLTVLSSGPGQPAVFLDEKGDARDFVADVAARKGVVAVSSHLGNIETLAAYGECAAKFHVFMALSLTGVFRRFMDRHARRSMIEIHPVEGFSMAELFLGDKIVSGGDVVLIAGDRGGGRSKAVPFLGGSRNFPEGAFRFAGHLERPVYFVASVRERDGYRVFARRLPAENLLGEYVAELERLVVMYPDQWYQWNSEEGGENG